MFTLHSVTSDIIVLAPTDHPLQIKRRAEPSHEAVFVFCKVEEVVSLRSDCGRTLLLRAEEEVTRGKKEKSRKGFLARTTKLQNGELYAYLLKRSENNSREWQRRWCVLRPDGIYHCLSRDDQSDIECIPLTHNSIEMCTNPELTNCFQIHTSQSIEYFRAKTLYECKEWVAAIQRDIKLASENDYFMLAEYMIADQQRAKSMRHLAILKDSFTSLHALLKRNEGLRVLAKYAKKEDPGGRIVILLYIEVMKALQQGNNGFDNDNHLSPGSLPSLGSVRLGDLPKSYPEWVSAIVERFNKVKGESEFVQQQVSETDEGAVKVLEEVREKVIGLIEEGLYKRFCESEEYLQYIASIQVT